MPQSRLRRSNIGTPAFPFGTTNGMNTMSDTRRWAVWLGRLTLETISRVTKGRLKRVRNPPKSLRAKAGLTGF